LPMACRRIQDIPFTNDVSFLNQCRDFFCSMIYVISYFLTFYARSCKKCSSRLFFIYKVFPCQQAFYIRM
jgi:hypothetical protein